MHRLLLIAMAAVGSTISAAERPNVVLIMTDNHGAWTLGCYGNKEIRTPNIDRLAEEGTLFTQAFASNPVCSPTRATLLTGLIPSQHGVHCFLRGGRLQLGPEARCTLDEVTSLPEVLSDAGYACGLVGKWHLGGNLTPQERFDDYWITMPHGGTSTFYDAQIIEDSEVRTEPKYLTDFWTEHAVQFLDQRAAEREKPFFLFLAYNGPYALSRLLLRDGKNRHAEFYADKELASFPREPAHPWQFHNLDYHNNPTSIRRVATEVSGVDDGVGTVMAALKERAFDENTIVVFVADQGWSGGHGGYFGMGDHTRPATAHDAMMRIPMIWHHPGAIAAGQRSNRLVTNYDFLPTLLSHLGMNGEMPSEPKSPGHDFSSEFKHQAAESRGIEQSADDAVFYEFEGLRCIRTPRWKYVHRHPNGPHELYDLAADADEFDNLVSRTEFASTRTRLKQRLEEFYDLYAEPKYDLWRDGGSQTVVYDGIEEELAQADPVVPPPLLAGFAPQKLKVPDGFVAELVAGPPLVQHPTFSTFDDRGRLFVCENAGVNLTADELEEQLPNSIRLLEDTDGDGRFDKSTVFADDMTFPMGGAWQDGALYVASPPSIWRLADTNDDGVADERTEIVNKFGYTGNAASIHGCVNGPDGRLYWCDGYHGHEFKDAEGRITSQRRGSYLFSSRPDGSDVQIHCGGGMDNPVEVDFTDEGEMLGTVNILYTRPRVDALVHWLNGGAYPHREQVLSELKVTGDLLRPVHRFGHVAVSGTMRYRSGVMDHRWRDDFFATFFNSGKVVRLELARRDATFEVVQREFLSCDNREFHPTDVVEDADGSLLVVDTGGWFYRGCPTSQFAKPDMLGGIYRVRREGMTTPVDPRGNRIDWDRLSDAELVKRLGDTRFAVRSRAITACTIRGASLVPLLSQRVKRGDIRHRRGALWTLIGIIENGLQGELLDTARAAIREALSDRDASVRQIACRVLTTSPDPAALEKLIEVLESDRPAVQRQAATALGRLGDVRAVPALLAVTSTTAADLNRALDHAAVYALIEINESDSVRRGLDSSNSIVQRRSLIALDQMDDGNLGIDEVVRLADSTNPDVKQTATKVFAGRSHWQSQSATVLRMLLNGPIEEPYIEIIRKLTTRAMRDDAVRELVGEVLQSADTSVETRELILQAIADSQNVPLHASWEKPLRAMLSDSADAAAVDRAISAIAALQAGTFDAQLKEIGSNESLPSLVRVSALEAASGRRGTLSDASLTLLIELLDAGPKVSLQAAQKIGSARLTPEQQIRIAPFLSTAGPAQLQTLIQAFQRFSNVDVAREFLAAMQVARNLTSLSSPQFSGIIKRYPQALLPKANALLERIRANEEARLIKLDKLMPLVAQGDPNRGEQLFHSEKTKCATCHRVTDRGGKVGPDLTTIGSNRAIRDLIESIVFPSATIVRDYEPYSMITVDGRTLTGLIIRESEESITVQQSTGDPIIVRREDIDEMLPSPVSIMPSDLDKSLTEEELADLVAYLASLKTVAVSVGP